MDDGYRYARPARPTKLGTTPLAQGGLTLILYIAGARGTHTRAHASSGHPDQHNSSEPLARRARTPPDPTPLLPSSALLWTPGSLPAHRPRPYHSPPYVAEAAPLSNPAITVPAALWLLGLGPAALAALAGLAGLGLQLVRDEEGGKLVPQRLHADTAAGWSTSHCRLEQTGSRAGLFRVWITLQPPVFRVCAAA